jgi:hypothetical protein
MGFPAGAVGALLGRNPELIGGALVVGITIFAVGYALSEKDRQGNPLPGAIEKAAKKAGEAFLVFAAYLLGVGYLMDKGHPYMAAASVILPLGFMGFFAWDTSNRYGVSLEFSIKDAGQAGGGVGCLVVLVLVLFVSCTGGCSILRMVQ